MRIIDADELMEHACRDKLDSRELIMKMIENAPTVKDTPSLIKIRNKIQYEIELLGETKDDETKLLGEFLGLFYAFIIVDKEIKNE